MPSGQGVTVGLLTSSSSQGVHVAIALGGPLVLVGLLAVAAARRWSKHWRSQGAGAGSPGGGVHLNPFLPAPPGSLSQGRNPLIHLMVFLWKEMMCRV